MVGGGSAGWLVAGVLAAELGITGRNLVSVTLVESPDVKTIGVGEGTWPTMRGTLQKIGITESEFLVECSASFKQGTKFFGWVTGQPDDSYHHPFTAPTGYTHTNLVRHWQGRKNGASFGAAVCPQAVICDRGLAPKQAGTPEYAAVANYGYHLDAGKFASLLQSHCISRLGVMHVLDHVTAVNGAENGDIRSLTTAERGDLEGDLFVDCSGLVGLLIAKHFGVSWISRRDVLFNDSALALQVVEGGSDLPIASQTLSTAREAGWIWDIGLTTRRGIGYTYSSQHTTDAAAERVLDSYVREHCRQVSSAFEPRKIAFNPGHRREFWHRNCVAVGMSAGFIEPLEASALVMVELSARFMVEEFPATRAAMDVVAKRFNQLFTYRWDRIIDFLKLHYVLSLRDDHSYWQDHREASGIPESLRDLLTVWRHRPPWHADFPHRDEVFSAASYQYVLYGMGFKTVDSSGTFRAEEVARAERLFAETSRIAEKWLAHLPANRELLRHVAQHGLPRAAPHPAA